MLSWCILVPSAVLAWDSGKDKWGETVSGTDKIQLTNDIRITLGGIVKGAVSLIGVIFFALTAYAGMLWLTSAGSDEKIGKAKKLLFEGVVGVVITLSAFAITQFVTQRLVNASTTEGCCDFGDGDCSPTAGKVDIEAAKTQCEMANGKWVEGKSEE